MYDAASGMDAVQWNNPSSSSNQQERAQWNDAAERSSPSKSSLSKLLSVAQSMTPSFISRVWAKPTRQSTPIAQIDHYSRHVTYQMQPNHRQIDGDFQRNDDDDIQMSDDYCGVETRTVMSAQEPSTMNYTAPVIIGKKRTGRVLNDGDEIDTYNKRVKLDDITTSPLQPSNTRRLWSTPTVATKPSVRVIPPSEESTVSTSRRRTDTSLLQTPSSNYFSIPIKAKPVGSSKPYSGKLPILSTFTTNSVVGFNSETRKILFDLERASGTPVSDARKMRLARRSIIGGPDGTRDGASPAPPLALLRPPERAFVSPRVSTLMSGYCSRLLEGNVKPTTNDVSRSDPHTYVQRVDEEEPSKIPDFIDKNIQLPSIFRFSKPIAINDSEETTHTDVINGFLAKDTCDSVSSSSTTISKAVVSTVSTTTADDGHAIVKPSNSDIPAVPLSIPPTSTSKATFDEFKKSPKWMCERCYFKNHPDDSNCCQCGRAKLEKQQEPLLNGSEDSDVSHASRQIASKTWLCKKCKLDNPDSVDLCKCCQTSRHYVPTEKPIPSNASSASWYCDVCCVTNAASSTNCVACGTENKNKPTAAKWTCSECFVRNEADKQTCLACGTAKAKDAKSAAAKKWACTTCFVSNDANVLKCITCTSSKPGTSFKPVNFGLGATTPAGGTNIFGLEKSAATNPPMSFGLPAETVSKSNTTTSKPSTTSTTTTTIQEKTGLFQFGVGAGSNSSASSAAPITFGLASLSSAKTTSTPTTMAASVVMSTSVTSAGVASTSSTLAAPSISFKFPTPVNVPETAALATTTTASAFGASGTLESVKFDYAGVKPSLTQPTFSSPFVFGSPATVVSAAEKPALSFPSFDTDQSSVKKSVRFAEPIATDAKTPVENTAEKKLNTATNPVSTAIPTFFGIPSSSSTQGIQLNFSSQKPAFAPTSLSNSASSPSLVSLDTSTLSNGTKPLSLESSKPSLPNVTFGTTFGASATSGVVAAASTAAPLSFSFTPAATSSSAVSFSGAALVPSTKAADSNPFSVTFSEKNNTPATSSGSFLMSSPFGSMNTNNSLASLASKPLSTSFLPTATTTASSSIANGSGSGPFSSTFGCPSVGLKPSGSAGSFFGSALSSGADGQQPAKGINGDEKLTVFGSVQPPTVSKIETLVPQGGFSFDLNKGIGGAKSQQSTTSSVGSVPTAFNFSSTAEGPQSFQFTSPPNSASTAAGSIASATARRHLVATRRRKKP